MISLSLEAELDAASRQLRLGLVSINELDSSTTSNYNYNDGGGSAGFVESYKAELDRISDALTTAGHGIESNARALLLHADVLARFSSSNDDSNAAVAAAAAISTTYNTPSSIANLRTQAQSISNRSLQLHAQTKADTTEFRRIAALPNLLLGTNDSVNVDLSSLTDTRRLESDPWMLDHSGGNVIVLLSDVYTVIRELEAKSSQPCRDSSDKDDTSNKKWVAPASFQRVTTKYWVHDEHLYQVLLASVSDLPLLVYVYGRMGE